VNATLSERLATLSTPHLADACLRVGAPVRCAPAGVIAVQRGMRCAGRALPVRHVGSVDVFLEALGQARPGDVLVVDNGGRLDEACVGDLVTLEVQKAGLHGIVIWGLHRDTDELVGIGLPLFSLGTMATGPQRLDPRPADSMKSARVGHWSITRQDVVACDSDGVLFMPEEQLPEIMVAATNIRETERQQAEKMRAGISLREQTRFEIRAGVRPQNPLKRSVCPWRYRQSRNAATISFAMEIDVASCLDSAHGAKSGLRGALLRHAVQGAEGV
jgi:4-hydroxy-4-methyl-2-oxoglutarate aldolase